MAAMVALTSLLLGLAWPPFGPLDSSNSYAMVGKLGGKAVTAEPVVEIDARPFFGARPESASAEFRLREDP